MDKSTKYLRFKELSIVGKKTKTISVSNNKHGFILGTIKWYAPWRQYCFFPSCNVLFNATCLSEVNYIIDLLKNERKAENDN